MARTCFQNRAFARAVLALLFPAYAAFSAACGSYSPSVAAVVPGAAGEAEAGADSGVSEPQALKVEFVPQDQIPLKPKESHELTVQTSPPAPFRIRFALFGGDKPDAIADAVLNASEVQADADGVAQVTLIAPSKPTKFSVRASSGSEQGQVGISVSATDFTALRVQPSYSGHRPITKWTATAQAGVSCTDLAVNPPPDGPLLQSAAPNQDLVLPRVPVGVALAVTVRAGHYIGGCVNVPALSEVDGNQALVYASDRALNLAATNLTLSLGASDAHPAFDKLLAASANVAETALLGDAKSDIAALLDGMSAAAATSHEAFDVVRAESAWDSALESAFGKSAARRLRDPAQRWLSAGLLALNEPDALLGKLAPLGSAATFTPTAVGPANPNDAGFPGFFTVRWSADSNDTVLLGMELNWEPSRLVTALAVAPALSEFPEATSVELALALGVGCAQVGQVLTAYGESPGSTAFAGCDESCAVALCSSAVAAAWNQAQLSSGAQIDTLSITASGAAQVGDDARATDLSGSWVGELRTDTQTAQVSGALSASSR